MRQGRRGRERRPGRSTGRRPVAGGDVQSPARRARSRHCRSSGPKHAGLRSRAIPLTERIQRRLARQCLQIRDGAARAAGSARRGCASARESIAPAGGTAARCRCGVTGLRHRVEAVALASRQTAGGRVFKLVRAPRRARTRGPRRSSGSSGHCSGDAYGSLPLNTPRTGACRFPGPPGDAKSNQAERVRRGDDDVPGPTSAVHDVQRLAVGRAPLVARGVQPGRAPRRSRPAP